MTELGVAAPHGADIAHEQDSVARFGGNLRVAEVADRRGQVAPTAPDGAAAPGAAIALSRTVRRAPAASCVAEACDRPRQVALTEQPTAPPSPWSRLHGALRRRSACSWGRRQAQAVALAALVVAAAYGAASTPEQVARSGGTCV